MSFGSGRIWMNGTLVDWADANISIASHVIHYGSGVFEGARCYKTAHGSACFRLDDHLRRLYDSARIYRMHPALTLDALKAAVLATIRANEYTACYIRPIMLPRVRFAWHQPVRVSCRHRDHPLGMGRLPGRRCLARRRRRPGRLVVTRGPQHISVARQEHRELRQRPAPEDGGGWPMATANRWPWIRMAS